MMPDSRVIAAMLASSYRPRSAHAMPLRALAMTILSLALLLAGGASAADEPRQIVVRVAAIILLTAGLMPLRAPPLSGWRAPLLWAGAVYALLLLQLAPLPPSLWAALPGHGVYARIAAATGTREWRPLSLTPDLTVNALLALLPASAAATTAAYLDREARLWLWRGVTSAALIGAGLGFVQLIAGSDTYHFYRVSSAGSAVGFFANRNHHAVFLACALPLVGMLTAQAMRDGAARHIALPFALAASGALLTGLAASGSRMGVIASLVGAAGALFAFRAGAPNRQAERPHRLHVAGWTVATLMIVAGIALAASRGGLFARLDKTDIPNESRIAILGPLWRTARAFMPLGSGLGSFDSVYRQFEPNALLTTFYMNEAHNEPLQLLIEGGLPAVILLGLFGWWWVRLARRALARAASPRRQSTAIAMVAIIVILMLASLVDYPLRTPLLGALFAVACVELMRLADRPPEAAPGPN